MNGCPARPLRALARAALAAIAASSLLSPGALAQGSDSCATPTPIATEGVFPFDATFATTAPPPASGSVMYCGDIGHNVWFRWQAPAAGGWVTITTCGQSLTPTQISVYRYQGAGCPPLVGTTAIYCSIAGCFPNATVAFAYVPNWFYVIELGSPPLDPPAVGTFTVDVTYLGPMTMNCLPGQSGVISCPCGQPDNPAGGCANFGSGATSGAVLDASGNASLAADTVVLTTSNHRPASAITNVFFTGSGALSTGVPHGAGVRCVNTALRRLYTGLTSGGVLSRPAMGDPSVSTRSAAVGVPIVAGDTRHYFNLYRDAGAIGPCGSTASTVNLTNTGSITWSP
jgi:hypothetical protein